MTSNNQSSSKDENCENHSITNGCTSVTTVSLLAFTFK